jgi:hypothetical protein
MFIVWTMLLVAWLLNWLLFWHYSNPMHKFLFLPACAKLGAIYLEYRTWSLYSEDGACGVTPPPSSSFLPPVTPHIPPPFFFWGGGLLFCVYGDAPEGACLIAPYRTHRAD